MARKSRKHLNAAVTPEFTTFEYKAAGYIRLSVEDNHKKGDSVETQKAILQNFIELSTDIELHDFYIDNGTTGTTFNRPAFQKMLSDVESGIINCIIVKDLSRFGRNAIDTGYYIEKHLPLLNVRFIAISDDFDSLRDMNNGVNIILPLKNMINEAYALDIGRKIRSQQHQAMKSGEFVGARPPYGYVKAPDNCHRLIIDPEAAAVVKQIFEWAYNKDGINTITRRLNEMGIEPPNIYSQRKGIINFRNLRSNNSWQTFAVSRILEDEAYIGDMVQGKTTSINHKQYDVPPEKWITVNNTHEPLISREMFTSIQEYRRQVTDSAKSRTVNPYTMNIFKGKIFCGHCGMPLHRQRGWKRKGASERMFVFHCLSNTRKARGSCETFTLPEDELIPALLTSIQKYAEAVLGKSIKLRLNDETVETNRTAVKNEIITLKQENANNERMLKSLYESLVSGLINADEYREMRDAYGKKSKANLDRANELENRQRELEKQVADYCELSELAKNAKADGITAELVDRLIERIDVFSDRSIKVKYKFDSEVTVNE